MSNEELTAGDYRDAANRYHYASPAGAKERWEHAVEEAVDELMDFWESDIGHAACVMLAKSGKVISFNVVDDGVDGSLTIDDEGFSRRRNDGSNATDIAPHAVIRVWCIANRGSVPKGFLHWLKAELKKIYDDAPRDPDVVLEGYEFVDGKLTKKPDIL